MRNHNTFAPRPAATAVPSRRDALLAIAAAGLLAPPFAAAQDGPYPSKPIRVIVPFPAGGGTDAAARMYAKWLEAPLGQPLVIENRAGATGAIGTVAVINAKPDGYTLLIGSDSSVLLGPLSSPTKTFDPIKDLSPVALTVSNPMVMVVNPSVKAGTPADFIKEAKQRPISYASIGEGSLFHFAGELFDHLTGTKMQHVPYKGAAPAIADVRAGHVEVMFCTIGIALPFIQQGTLKPIAVLGDQRSAFLPNTPTLKESGLPNYSVESWGGIFAPAKTPQPVIDRLVEAVRQLTADVKFQEEVRNAGSEIPKLSPTQVTQMLTRQQSSYAQLYEEVKMAKKVGGN